MRDLLLFAINARHLDLGLDLDIEVHGIEQEVLTATLNLFGPTTIVGKAFGVIKTPTLEIDWSLQRTDSIGRWPVVEIDHMLSIEQALDRRDITINSMAWNLTAFLTRDSGPRLNLKRLKSQIKAF